MTAAHTMPNSEKAERFVLGNMLCNPESLPTALSSLRATDFYATTRAKIFDVAERISRVGGQVDPVLVLEALQRETPVELQRSALSQELDQCFIGQFAADIEPHCTFIRKLSEARALIAVCGRIAQEGISGIKDPDEWMDRAEASLQRVVAARGSEVRSRAIGDVIDEVVVEIGERAKHRGIVGIPTGITALDAVTGGLRNGKLYVVAGRPGMGKSALAQLFASSSGQRCKHVEFFSLEMPSTELVERMLSSHASVDGRAIGTGKVNRDQMQALMDGARALDKLPIAFPEAHSMLVEDICRIARRQRASHAEFGCVVVDYLQLVRSRERDDGAEKEVASVSRALKLLAMELNCPVIAVAQLNRKAEERPDKRPRLSDLRDSGAIEQDADVVLLLYRDEYYNANTMDKGLCEIIVAKQRGGPTGMVKALFVKEHTRFSNLQHGDEYGGGDDEGRWER